MPNYTNKANLPAPLVAELIRDDYDGYKYDITASGLVMPPRIRQLEKRHDSEITVDVSELIYRVMGRMGHNLLQHAQVDNVLREERLEAEVLGWTVGGKFDLLRRYEGSKYNWMYAPATYIIPPARDTDTYAIDDYKFTSLWAAKEAKPEWEFQLNTYAWLAELHGFKITQLRSVNIFRDWSKLKAAREKDKGYPQQQVMVREVPVWSTDVQLGKIEMAVIMHKMAEGQKDADLPLCTPEERWQKPAVWAVKKRGNKRALPGGLHSTREAADLFSAANDAPTEIEYRPGIETRCLNYCAVKDFCDYGRSLGNTTESEEI